MVPLEGLNEWYNMEDTVNIRELNDQIASKSSFVSMIRTGMDRRIVGQEHLVDSLLIALLCNGHILLEGVPGLAKTLAIKTLANLVDAKYSRIQFTPDLLPADVLGTQIYSVKKEEFQIKKGPIFANFVLADEINRAPAKVQSALLEAMQERQVTIGEETFRLPDPFLVMATQNPIEQEGTYPLPEAQVDRFLLKVVIGYPKKDEEKLIIRQNIKSALEPVRRARSQGDSGSAEDSGEDIYRREDRELYRRHSIRHTYARQIWPERPAEPGIVRSIAPCLDQPCVGVQSLRIPAGSRIRHSRRRTRRMPCHRTGLTYEAEANNITSDDIITDILDKVAVP